MSVVLDGGASHLSRVDKPGQRVRLLLYFSPQKIISFRRRGILMLATCGCGRGLIYPNQPPARRVFAHSQSGASQFFFFFFRHFKLTASRKVVVVWDSGELESRQNLILWVHPFLIACVGRINSPKDRALHTHSPV
jgi:hypothetical protein